MVLYVPSCIREPRRGRYRYQLKVHPRNKASRRNTPLYEYSKRVGEERGRGRAGERDLTYEVDIDDGLERVLGETAYGCQAAIKESGV
jgi:hypothetical protein